MTPTAAANKPKIYFQNLNGLRFIAAMLVIVHHIEGYKYYLRIDGALPYFKVAGPQGVILFFVLSGFLITYLLLAEEKQFSNINVKKFYIRRILRIWPLYFLIIILAFFVLPYIPFFTLPDFSRETIYSQLPWKMVLYFLLFPNLACVALSTIPYASHTWSIGTEEQFYIVWPLLMKYIKRHRLFLMFGIIVFYFMVLTLLRSHVSEGIPYRNILLGFWSSFNIDCMAIGGIFAVLYFQKSRFLAFLQNNTLFYASVLLTVFLLAVGFDSIYFHSKMFAILFGIIILNFAVNDTIKISLESHILRYLGSISYGLYMYHPIAIIFTMRISVYLGITSNWFIYPVTIISTIMLAAISYHYFESFFLKLKDKFSDIRNGQTTKNIP